MITEFGELISNSSWILGKPTQPIGFGGLGFLLKLFRKYVLTLDLIKKINK
jgi:hypothetical protein